MSLYRGTVTLSVIFHADSGTTADEVLEQIATEIREEVNDDCVYDDPENEWMPADTFYSVTDSVPVLPAKRE